MTKNIKNQREEDCCELETKINKKVDNHKHSDGDGHNHNHNTNDSTFKLFLPSIISFGLLAIGLFLEHVLKSEWFNEYIRIAIYLLAYTPVGIPVLKDAVKSILKKDVFSEFFLMGIATIGAIIIGEYPEAVAVMLFYSVGEVFQTLAVSKAKRNIKSLIDQRPDVVNVLKNGTVIATKAEEVQKDDIIQLKVGEKLALDGVVVSEKASFNTSALTGESKPATMTKGEVALAGMINLNQISEIQVSNLYEDSKLSKILDLVENAVKQKAPTELFIRKFAKIYTPFVVLLAFLIVLIPFFIVNDFVFKVWLYRALVFLVISCPCALVISIPLGYFGGIGAASKNGILFKGSNYLDVLANVQHIAMDKTGTLTEGVFQVQSINFNENFDKKLILDLINTIESKSTHPIASAIKSYIGNLNSDIILNDIQEISGHGMKAIYQDNELLVGNFKLLDKFNISYNFDPNSVVETLIAVAYKKTYVGYIVIADKIKEDAQEAIYSLKTKNIKISMLSGDKKTIVEKVAKDLGIVNYYGGLLPEDKATIVSKIKEKDNPIAFIGDGINDAPVLALSDVGIAMGGLGSDAAIETADIIIQDDKPSKIALAINIGKETKKIVWQNISLAFIVKAIVLILGAGGLATMWEAVFADIGVALIAILNAIRIQNKKW